MSPDKRRIRKTIHDLNRVKTWQLVIVLILMLFVTATFLRINNVGMSQRRDAVLVADKNNQLDEVRARLFDLQRYSVAHMNASTDVFYLQGEYDRDSQQAIEQIKAANGGQSVNAKAEAVCHPLFSGYSTAYRDCMVNEITKSNQVADPAALPKLPDPSLYRYSYVSPVLSFDFAGASVIICLLIIFVILARVLSLLALKIMLTRHYRGI